MICLIQSLMIIICIIYVSNFGVIVERIIINDKKIIKKLIGKELNLLVIDYTRKYNRVFYYIDNKRKSIHISRINELIKK